MGACNRYTFEAVWLSLQQFARGVRLLIHLSDNGILICGLAVLSEEVRWGPNYFPLLIDLPSAVSNVDSTFTRATQTPSEIRSVRVLVTYSI